jgi:hypothetical protein
VKGATPSAPAFCFRLEKDGESYIARGFTDLQRISPKRAAILVTRPADKINDDQQQLLNRIETQCPEVIDFSQNLPWLPGRPSRRRL